MGRARFVDIHVNCGVHAGKPGPCWLTWTSSADDPSGTAVSPTLLAFASTAFIPARNACIAGVEGHFKTERPWMTVDETVRDASARLVGAQAHEVSNEIQVLDIHRA